MSNSQIVDKSCESLVGTEQIQRYAVGALVRDQRLHGVLPFKVGVDDAVQEVFLDLIECQSALQVPVSKRRVAKAVKRVISRQRDRKYQRRRRGLPEICELDFEPAGDMAAEVARLAADLENDVGSMLSDEEAIIWHKLAADGNKTVREIGTELGMRHQRVSEVRRKLESTITDYLLSHD